MKHSRKEKTIAILTILPSFAAICVFVYGFIAWSARVSLSDWRGIRPDYTFVGLKNYISLFKSDRFLIDIYNNAFFSLFFLLFCICGGLLLTIMLGKSIKGESVFRTVYLLPMAIPAVVTAVVWKWIFAPSTGRLGFRKFYKCL